MEVTEAPAKEKHIANYRQFEFTDDTVDEAARLCRRTILFRIAAALTGGKVLSPAAAANLVLHWWRQTIGRLMEASDLTSPSKMRHFNCFPSSVRVKEFGNVVRCAHAFCPWCRTRQAQERIWATGYGEHERYDRLYAMADIGFLKHTWRIPMADGPGTLRQTLIREAKACAAFRASNRSRLIGSAWRVTVEPVVDSGAAWWQSDTRILLMTRKRPELQLPDGQWAATFAGATMDRLGLGLEELLQYPVGLLKAPPAMLLPILAARRKLRLSQAVGAFRTSALAGEVSESDRLEKMAQSDEQEAEQRQVTDPSSARLLRERADINRRMSELVRLRAESGQLSRR